ncbi:chemotaxis protein CheA [bacterium]|nr:chemotaxis protein CheA [bacterium]
MALSPEKLRQIFLEEAEDILLSFEQNLIELETNPDDTDSLNNVFRAVHTMKGSAGMVDFHHLAHFLHEVEELLVRMQKKMVTVNDEIISLLFECYDIASVFINDSDNIDNVLAKRIEQFSGRIQKFQGIQSPIKSAALPDKEESDFAEKYIHIVMKFNPDIFLTGTDPLMLLRELSEIGTFISLKCDTATLPSLDELNFEVFYLSWDGVFKTTEPISAIDNIFIFVKDDHFIHFEDVSSNFVDGINIEYADQKLGEILHEEGLLQKEDVEQIVQTQKKSGELLVEQKKIDQKTIDRVLKQQQQSKQIRQATTIRVSTGKLDNLVNRSGEMVIAVSNIAQIISEQNHAHEFTKIVEKLQRLSSELQEEVMRVRMVPVGTTFRAFNRLIRDTSLALGKRVELYVSGSDTELDKNINEGISAPLTHLLRNAIDHGIETPEERIKQGKPPEASLWLRAFQKEGKIIIEVEDDGQGIDKEAVVQKAKEQGLIKNEELSTEEIYNLIMTPGFSTVEQVSEISGRGVGMDVVRKSIEMLRGTIEIYSESGVGTLFRIKLPLTLAVIDGMLISVGDQILTMPMLSIIEAFYLKKENLQQVEGNRELLHYNNNYIPFIRLHDLFGFPTKITEPEDGVILVVEGHNRQIALMADSVIGQQQAVIKSFSHNFREVKYVSGATILGNGNISLIIDVHNIELESVRGGTV